MADFSYLISITGDCQSLGTGQIEVGFSGGTPPYSVNWFSPIGRTDFLIDNFIPGNNSTYSIVTGLTSGTYGFRVNDSTLPTNLEYVVNVPISNGNCTNILDVSATTCNQNNGRVTADASSDYSSTSYFLYTNNDVLVQSGNTELGQFTFNNLSAGTYYVTSVDFGGCSGVSQSFIVNPSVEVDYGFYSVPDTQCGGASGKLIITGQTGVPPWSYIWNNGTTGSTLSGLTAGTYSVKVTDSSGCSLIKEGVVGQVDPVGLGYWSAVTIPTCFSSNGSLRLVITGGTGPYYYSASTGQVEVSYLQYFDMIGIPAGAYNVSVTDASLCKFVTGTDLATENGISDIQLNITQSTCSAADGSIQITIIGGLSPFTYTLVYPDASTVSLTSNAASFTFTQLSGGSYTVIVEDVSGCYFLKETAIIGNAIFTLNTITSGTTCGGNNGIIQVQKSVGGVSPFDYSLDGTSNFIDTTASAVTFTNVSAGQHTVTVTDAAGCSQIQNVFVEGSVPLSYNLYSTSCGTGADGSITAFISDGVPPFSFNWSNNIPGNPQDIKATGLTAGTYSVTIIDSSGCSQTRSITIDCNQTYVSYQTYVMGEGLFTVASPTKRGIGQMYNEGFDDLTAGNTNCDLVSAIFTAQVSIQPLGQVVQQQFFTSNSLVQIPTDSLWYSTLENLLEGIYGIGNVTINELTNEIIIETDRTTNILHNQELSIELIIVYDIMCLT